jgi:ketosteroid isomerase-like protein
MSQENVEIIRRFYEAQDDPSRILSFFDPAVVLTNTPKSPEAGTFVGHEGIRKWIVGVREAIDEPRWYADDLIDAGEDRVIAPGGVLGRGRATSLPVDIRLTTLYTLREGKIAELHANDTTEEALEAAGLSK